MRIEIHRILSVVLVLIILYSLSYSQQYNNYWINYNQEYYRIAIHEDGLYKISYQELQAAGVPVGSIDPRNIQVFHNGEEQHIYIKGESGTGIFDPGGHIEFYGKRNRGELDLIFFDNPQSQVNPDYSFYSDTSSYFLTWNNSTSNRRINYLEDLDFSAYIEFAPNYCYRKIRTNYTGTFYWGSSRALFTSGEGYFDNLVITETTSRTKTIQVPNLFQSSAAVELELAVVGVPASSITSNVPHHLKVQINGNLLIDATYNGYQFVRRQLSIPSADLGSSISFVFSSNDITQPDVTDRNAVSYIEIKYPHNWSFTNTTYYEIYLPENSLTTKDYIEISNFNFGSEVFIYDLRNHKRIKTLIQDNIIKALIPNTESERLIAIVNANSYKPVEGIYKISGNNKFVDYTSQNPETDYFIVTHNSLVTSANQYANYRNSLGFKAIVVDIDQLYYQFAFGVKKHPSAIRSFCDYAFSVNNRPAYLFLIGKSIHSRLIRNNVGNYAACLVPSGGHPASDNLLTAGLAHTNYQPLFPTGRISAVSNQEVIDYLNKVKEYEANSPAEWMKNIIHFGGGANASEQTSFANYLNNYKNIIEDTLFGARVSSFFKTSSEPIQITQSDSVRNLIESGSTMMTFFGHASASGFDQSIDNPDNYNNKGRYPFILANSCFSGDIHISGSNSVSENWVKLPDRGAIGFFASVGQGYAPYLNVFSAELYRNIGYKMYNKSIGVQIINTIDEIQNLYPDNISLELTCHEFTLHGDPALVLNSHSLPDLVLSPDGVKFIPNEITTEIDSFEIALTIKNVGRATSREFIVSAERKYPDGKVENYENTVDGCNYIKIIKFKMPVNRADGPGINSIRFYADSSNEIEELNENNNEIIIKFIIKSGDLIPIYPYKYSIYPDNKVNLIASSIDPFIETSEYWFKIDTSDYYNSLGGSPMAEATVLGQGGLISWEVPFLLNENTVYYWQIAKKHHNQDSLVWKESSFIHIPGEEGWSQAHFYQFKENSFRFIDYNRQNRKFEYITTPKQLHCHNIGSVPPAQYNQVRWTIDGAVMDGDGDYGIMGGAPAMMVVVIDPQTLKAWPSDMEDYGHRNYPNNPARGGRPDYYYIFNSGSGDTPNLIGLQAMNTFLQGIPNDFYILIYSWNNGYFEQWTEDMYQTFESFGSLHIRSIQNSIPYIFFTKKGIPNQTDEWERFGSSINSSIDLYVNLETDFNYGYITSVLAGPSAGWKSLHWAFENNENPDFDEITLSVYGINNAGTETKILQDITPEELDIYYLEDSINYNQYPYLKLNFYAKNEDVKIPPQLTKWQIRYISVPETAIDPNSGFYFCCDTVDEGADIKFAIATKNISTYNMDSLVVKYWLQDSRNNITDLDIRKLRTHPAGDIIIDTIVVSSLGLSGVNSVWVQYNPIDKETGTYFQREQYYFNNIAARNFYVKQDLTNPLLDVSFDGRHIMDGDIVSSKPEILIRLKDENKYLELNDTSLFRIYLTNLQSGVEKRIYFVSQINPEEDLIWIPASLPDNSCQIIYKPIFQNDGMYQLRVQATDVSSNESGKNDYVIRFEVITKSAITHLLNYPNPFSTSTRFVFELTGDIIPDDMRIEIFTVTGKLVKVIFREELGSIVIGRNITEYAWDGKDMFGDRLANGIYFYRVKASINGQAIEHRATDADKYFKQETGKMYLIR